MKNQLSRHFLALCAAFFMAATASSQDNDSIWFTLVPEWGNASMNLFGKVNADPQNYRVAGIIFVEEGGGWWTKPSFASPTIPILADSSFNLDFTTGGLDAFCTRLVAVLVPNGFDVPLFSGAAELPEDLLAFNPYAVVARPHGDRMLNWKGLDWTVKRSVNGIAVGPGPNLFSPAETQVFVDEDSCLHLTITSNGLGQWLCSEVIADTSFGYGTYTFNIKSRVDNIDLNTVIGIFTWDDIARYSKTFPDNFFREYDIEFSYWSIPGNDVCQYVIQPWDNPGNIFRFQMGSEINTIHQWTWKKDTIVFRSLAEDSSLIAEFEYTGSDFHYPDLENVRMNLWLVNGLDPLSAQEVVISGFEFENLLTAPQNVIASDGELSKITITWDEQPGKYYGIYRNFTDDPMGADLLTEEWITENAFVDSLVEPEITYYYWVRSGDNPLGSNKTGYASGYSDYDTGWSVDSTVSVISRNPAGGFKISPNPCKETCKINFDMNATALLHLYNSAGSLILKQWIQNGVVINTGTLLPGIYFVNLTCGHLSYTGKMIVIH